MSDWVEFAQHLVKKIDAEVESVEVHVADGGCSSFDDYRYQVGRVHGLKTARDTVRALLKNTGEYEDD
jgi:hypothetical protein